MNLGFLIMHSYIRIKHSSNSSEMNIKPTHKKSLLTQFILPKIFLAFDNIRHAKRQIKMVRRDSNYQNQTLI